MEKPEQPSRQKTSPLWLALAAASACGGDAAQAQVEELCAGTTRSQEAVLNQMSAEDLAALRASAPVDEGTGETVPDEELLDLPRVSITLPEHCYEMNGRNIRVQFSVPPFDERALSEFVTNGCSAFPMKVRIKARLLRHPANIPGNPPVDDPQDAKNGCPGPESPCADAADVVIGEKEILDPRLDFIEGMMPLDWDALTAFRLELLTMNPETGEEEVVAQTPSVEVEDFGAALLDNPTPVIEDSGSSSY